MRKIVQFAKDCRGEMQKVVWPSRPEVMSSVVVVLVSTFIIAIVLALLDAIFVSGMKLIFDR
jgi:preprotein translocase subunit SecE